MLKPLSLSLILSLTACGGSAVSSGDGDSPVPGDGDGDGDAAPGDGDGDGDSTSPSGDGDDGPEVIIIDLPSGDGDGDAGGDGDGVSMGGAAPVPPPDFIVDPPPQEVDGLDAGNVGISCGANLTSNDFSEPDPIDCTAYGDAEAQCVFGNHCWCSEGFACAEASDWGQECAERVTCIPEDWL